jgi:hypothetical protein
MVSGLGEMFKYSFMYKYFPLWSIALLQYWYFQDSYVIKAVSIVLLKSKGKVAVGFNAPLAIFEQYLTDGLSIEWSNTCVIIYQ